jgi:hypothetical protein
MSFNDSLPLSLMSSGTAITFLLSPAQTVCRFMSKINYHRSNMAYSYAVICNQNKGISFVEADCLASRQSQPLGIASFVMSLCKDLTKCGSGISMSRRCAPTSTP